MTSSTSKTSLQNLYTYALFIYELTGFGFVDSLGALGLIYFAVREGQEAFQKARQREDCPCSQE